MKRHFSIFILLFYLFSTTELRELVKVPVLFQHYIEHKELNQTITFTRYILDHYNSIPHTDDDQERDNQLPFKSNVFNVLISPAIPVPHAGYFHKVETLLPVNDSFLYREHFVSLLHSGDIWQPPKFI